MTIILNKVYTTLLQTLVSLLMQAISVTFGLRESGCSKCCISEISNKESFLPIKA